ncbi:hypothetical protein AVEN_157073-1 [Araneus ventricosus]|uniref:Uncharacterized protein n=1 Tax=Araneus ventricosus TaxID=182803 RepID=A0A4Y2GML6_ARAVE|nr:hypothetical protein AVEN_157073-1 [Araneus ventricosus]
MRKEWLTPQRIDHICKSLSHSPPLDEVQESAPHRKSRTSAGFSKRFPLSSSIHESRTIGLRFMVKDAVTLDARGKKSDFVLMLYLGIMEWPSRLG